MNLMDLMIAIGVEDTASSQLSAITTNAKKTAQSLGTGFANAVKVGSAAIAGMTAGVGALTKASVENYAQFEQLVGGVETLFGHGGKTIEEYAASVGKTVDQVTDAYQYMQDSIDSVLADADAAFQTAGLSANEYMETITSFAASLNQALGGDTMAASKLANQTIIDMADNANKMGSTMSSIQNAYMGFAKQNYSMLDNLKLGYGGTQEEMYRLMEDAAKLNEEFAATADFWMDSKGHLWTNFADVSKAIHIIQEEMGIMGTTAEEASETISGSMAAAKSALDNLLTGFADENADLGVLVDNLVDSVITVADNLLPRINQAVDGIITSFGELIGVDLSGVAEKFSEFGNKAIEVARGLIGAFSEGGIFGVFGEISEMFQRVTGIDTSFITEKFRAIGAAIREIQEAFGEGGFEGGLAEIFEQFAGLTGVDISGFVTGLREILSAVMDAAPEIIENVAAGINGILAPFQTEEGQAGITAIGTAIKDFILMILDSDFTWIRAVGEGIGELIEPIVSAAPEIIANVKSGIAAFLRIVAGTDKVTVKEIATSIMDMLKSFTASVANAMTFISEKFAAIMQWAEDNNVIANIKIIAASIVDMFGAFTVSLGPLITIASEAFGKFVSWFTADLAKRSGEIAGNLSYIFNVLSKIAALGIGGTADGLSSAANAFKALISGDIAGLFEENYKFNEEQAGYLADLWGALSMPAGEDYFDALEQQATEKTIENMKNAGINAGIGVSEGIREGLSSSDPTLRQAYQDLDDRTREINEINSPSRRYARIGKFMAQGISVGWLDGMKDVKRDISESMNFDIGNISMRDSMQSTTLRDSVRDILSGIVTMNEDTGEGAGVPIVLELDGERVAHGIFNPLQSEYRRRGAKLGVAIE